MDDVIENCQTTFEEDGVNQQTLEDLRSVGARFLGTCPDHFLSSYFFQRVTSLSKHVSHPKRISMNMVCIVPFLFVCGIVAGHTVLNLQAAKAGEFGTFEQSAVGPLAFDSFYAHAPRLEISA